MSDRFEVDPVQVARAATGLGRVAQDLLRVSNQIRRIQADVVSQGGLAMRALGALGAAQQQVSSACSALDGLSADSRQRAVLLTESEAGMSVLDLGQALTLPVVGVSDVLGTPDVLLPGPSDVLGGPSVVLPGPSEVLGGPSVVLPGPSDVLGGPSVVLPGPSDVLGGPGVVLPGPSDTVGLPEVPIQPGPLEFPSGSGPGVLSSSSGDGGSDSSGGSDGTPPSEPAPPAEPDPVPPEQPPQEPPPEEQPPSDQPTDRNPAQDKKLTPDDIRRLKQAGDDPHDIKGQFGPPSHSDLYKDREGNIYVKPKGGSGPGEYTGININDL